MLSLFWQLVAFVYVHTFCSWTFWMLNLCTLSPPQFDKRHLQDIRGPLLNNCILWGWLLLFTLFCFLAVVERGVEAKNDHTAAVVKASPKLTEYRICSAPCVHRTCTVVFVWKCCLFCLCAHGQCRVHHIYHVEFHFWFRCLVSFPGYGQIIVALAWPFCYFCWILATTDK